MRDLLPADRCRHMVAGRTGNDFLPVPVGPGLIDIQKCKRKVTQSFRTTTTSRVVAELNAQ